MTRPWYHRPEWISSLLGVVALVGGLLWGEAQTAAQTLQNTRDIAQLRQDNATVPSRLARIEQKVDDLRDELRHPAR
jgi:cell division protein FtsB